MRHLLAAALLSLVAACGGGGGGGGGSGGGGGTGGTPTPTPTVTQTPTSSAEAGRLLEQASFGPTQASIDQVRTQGITGWIDAQIAAPVPTQSHLAYINARVAAGVTPDATTFYQSWWRQAVTEPGQLRQRVAFALSQIFVISLNDPTVDARGAASYYDMLNANAFANYRRLLEDVTLHPMMGRYLTYLGNQKEDAAGTRTPDENYAREVMQLMSVGLWELNADGTQRLSGGNPIPAYDPADIAGLAKVFTGISWYHSSPNNTTFLGGNAHTERSVTQMIFYPNYHSTSQKEFLTANIPANTTVDVNGDLRIALDTIANHPNVGPFISQRLIQQLVTSNPSPAYVGRVSAVFANNGSGVRGDLGAVVKAILTDTEARTASTAAGYGKLKEPVIRTTQWMRAFNASSRAAAANTNPAQTTPLATWTFGSTSANTSLGQSPLSSPSVFNFWRPGFVPPGSTELGQRSLTAPEFQTVDEVTTASYINVMQDWVNSGVGATNAAYTGRDVQPDYSAEVALSGDPAALAERMNTLLFHGAMTATTRTRLEAAITAVTIPTLNTGGTNQAAIDTARLNRAKTAVFFSVISPDFLVQR